MRTVQAVAWKEIQIYFGTPIAYIVGMIFLALTGIFFAAGVVPSENNPFPEATLSNFFQWSTTILILLAPALTMRLLAEEQKLGTIELLLTSPVRDWEIIVGKYLASFTFLSRHAGAEPCTIPFCSMSSLTRTLAQFTRVTWGLVLYGASALAIGMLTSTVTSNQIVAGFVAMGIIARPVFCPFQF